MSCATDFIDLIGLFSITAGIATFTHSAYLRFGAGPAMQAAMKKMGAKATSSLANAAK